jgi:hypothetical protein
MIIINAGSEYRGGTFEQAKVNAEKWLKNIHIEGFLEVEMSFVKQYEDGNFLFNFIHGVTKKIATLETHGFTEEELKFRFHPRVYWNGSSTADPKIEDWLEEGFDYKIQYYKKHTN